eukprot:1654031-Amphidinium_carterae.1
MSDDSVRQYLFKVVEHAAAHSDTLSGSQSEQKGREKQCVADSVRQYLFKVVEHAATESAKLSLANVRP